MLVRMKPMGRAGNGLNPTPFDNNALLTMSITAVPRLMYGTRGESEREVVCAADARAKSSWAYYCGVDLPGTNSGSRGNYFIFIQSNKSGKRDITWDD